MFVTKAIKQVGGYDAELISEDQTYGCHYQTHAILLKRYRKRYFYRRQQKIYQRIPKK